MGRKECVIIYLQEVTVPEDNWEEEDWRKHGTNLEASRGEEWSSPYLTMAQNPPEPDSWVGQEPLEWRLQGRGPGRAGRPWESPGLLSALI